MINENYVMDILDIMKYLEYLASTYPSLVKLETIGRSYEGQPLKVIKISSGKKKSGATKPTVWIDAGEKLIIDLY